ncbi:interleukin-23 receptor isoform X3 [Micropterus salmoides]|uniref:interleukin-23 receptor isoform X3 n=1 Tax=Micropterus salmoides TaxID=27706 RepID=UPI0018EC8E17|nr:interleukin-23 receptor isoform X3 [Micropterus salmoides]
MNLYSTIWRFIMILHFSIKGWPLLPAGCQQLNRHGHVTVEPSPLFLIGSNLTVYCRINKCELGDISLVLNNKPVAPGKRVNCTMMIFNLVNVRIPKSTVVCKLTMKIVDGKDLHGGLPPDKPENIICETTRSSDFTNCSWERGQETYLPTTYNVTVNSENGTQILSHQKQASEKITIPRAKIDENTKYQLIITAYNHFGASQSDPFILCVKDIVIPETPRLMHIEFGNDSTGAMLHWKSTESSDHLRSYVRLRTENGFWRAVEGTELSEGLIQMVGLRPLTEYEFQMRTCKSTSRLTYAKRPMTPSSRRSFCSEWSPSVRGKSPGKGPSQQLHVWSILGSQKTNGERMVTVLWKPLSPEDYGEVQRYRIFLGNDQKEERPCDAALNQCSVQVPADVQALSISAVTLYGTSPPADVPLRHSGDFRPVLRKLTPAGNGSAVFVSWTSPGNKHWSASGGKLLHYVLEWTHVPAPVSVSVLWQKLAKDQNNTSITEPGSSPKMSILVHKARRIWIQWDELPVDQQRGFITHYTIYLHILDSNNTEVSVTVAGSGPRKKWLDCPEGALALQLTASTSVGEGPRGSWISSRPATPVGQSVGLVIVIVFITFFIAIIANLMCWSCVRERIKQKCISWGPAWFDENLPKPGNSLAIRLLEQYGSEPSFPSSCSDPPLSPISFLSQDERDDEMMYPNIHVEISQVGSELPTWDAPLSVSDTGTTLVDSRLEHVSYKPQIAVVASQGEEVKQTDEEQRDVPTSGEEERCSSAFGGLLSGLLSSVELDFSDSPLGLTLCSVGSVLQPTTPETKSVLDGGFSMGQRLAENNVEAASASLDLQPGETMTPDTADTCLSLYTLETTLTGGYFPQVAAVSSTTTCEAQR